MNKTTLIYKGFFSIKASFLVLLLLFVPHRFLYADRDAVKHKCQIQRAGQERGGLFEGGCEGGDTEGPFSPPVRLFSRAKGLLLRNLAALIVDTMTRVINGLIPARSIHNALRSRAFRILGILTETP